MANERKTEAIVRSHFLNFADEIKFEEQQSDNPSIGKLLKTASKAGNGKGYPEFIIQLKDKLPGFVVVIECKADVMKHESLSRIDYAGYAVDGALLYSSYLSRDFDVLSIAVSGETRETLKVSHFLQLRGENTAKPIAGDKLLSMEDYEAAYLRSPDKFKQDYDALITFSKDLNDNLHTHKILESDRSLLLSCILIALSNEAFETSYEKYKEPEALADYLVNTVKHEFKEGKVGDKKLKILENRFGFITTDTSLSSKKHVLRDIIKSIDENINQFVRTHRYFDVLGQMYIEFLRYANSDKGLGIVLTPPHITEFMAELGEVNKNSVVYDSCTGTGGFLVSAMNLMIKDAHDDSERIASIKQHQLIGVEYQANIFALACSNMFIHQDGKSNILNGSCFDEEIMSQVKSYHPTVGLLNPPYKSDKKNDIEELEFVLSNLECLEQGGKCVAIIPMQAALAQKGKIYELKKKLLERHTLDAVFSMPDELFFNSKVGVVSCVMVFTAKRPHPAGQKTYFGYYKDDGFVKRKNKGRIDLFGEFSEKKKELWVQTYRNREVIDGLSVYRHVGADDEWCAEAYMETDYSNLAEDDFIKEIRKYTASQITSGIL